MTTRRRPQPARGSRLTAAQEIRRHWPLLAVALIGGSLLPIAFYAVSLFMEDWQREFGWSRGDIAIANSSFTVALVISSPVAGWLIDRYGPRRPAMVSVVMLAGAFALVSQIGPDLGTLYAAYALVAVAGSATSPIAFTRSVCAYFHSARGLALGITVTGTALASMVAPIVVAATLDRFGWRGSWFAFSALALAVLPLLALWLKDPATDEAARDAQATGEQHGMTLQQAARASLFWILALSFFLTSTAILAALGHMTAILRDSGVSAPTALLMQSAMGVGLIGGRLFCGYVVDRVFAPRVYQIICTLAAAGFLLLAAGWGTATAAIGIVLIGVAMGAEYDLVAYLVSRYFGLAHYGRIYGWQYAITMLGGVVGPFVIAYAYGSTGDYGAYLLLAAGLLAVAALLLKGLGPYPRYPAPGVA